MNLAADCIENRTFDDIAVGDSASLSHKLARRDIELFAVMSGDVNPAHVDPEFAKSDMFHKIIAHGMWGGALISTVLSGRLKQLFDLLIVVTTAYKLYTMVT